MKSRKVVRKHKNKSRKSRVIRKKGGCGNCSRITGGSNHLFFNSLNVIPYNTNISYDPNNPSNVMSERIHHTGGYKKSRKNRKNRQNRQNKKVGGFFSLADYNKPNMISGFGTTTGTLSAVNSIFGKPVVDPSVTVQPIGTFGPHNPALV